MGEVIAWRKRPDRAETTARMGMLIYLGAWSMMFAALFFSFAFVRAQAAVWPPPGTVRLPQSPLYLSAAVLAALLGALQGARAAIRRRLPRQLVVALFALSALAALGFVGLQVWEIGQGRSLHLGGEYGALTLSLLFFHAVIAAGGLPCFAVLLPRAWKGLYSPQRHIGPGVWLMYWKYVGAVWLLVLALIHGA